MASSSDLHVDPGGGFTKPKTQSPKAIKAWGQARDSFARTLIGGGVLLLLGIGYCVALYNKLESASNILVVIASGLGFLLGSGRGKTQDDEG